MNYNTDVTLWESFRKSHPNAQITVMSGKLFCSLDVGKKLETEPRAQFTDTASAMLTLKNAGWQQIGFAFPAPIFDTGNEQPNADETPVSEAALNAAKELFPHGMAHYCYSTQEQNEAAKLEDWKAAARKIDKAFEFRTSKRIGFITDSWGGMDGETHAEIKLGKQTVMLDIVGEKLTLTGPCVDVKQTAMNQVEITSTYN